MKVLVVDDDVAVRVLLEEMIRKLSPESEIKVANNGVEAWDKFQDNEFDVIVTDFWMPNMDGLEFLKHVKASGKKVIAVLVSGYCGMAQVRSGVEDLGFKFLSKPLKLNDLKLAISG